MRRYSLYSLLMVAAMTLLLSSCDPEYEMVTIDMGAYMEQPYSDSDSKNYLVNEEFIYWEEGDRIAVSSESDNINIGTLRFGAGTPTAFYRLTIPVDADGDAYGAYAAVYPYEAGAKAMTKGGGTTQRLDYPDTMPYRAGATNADFTFGQNSYPMVAYSYASRRTAWDPRDSTSHDTLGFHSVSGILRLQFYAATGQSKTIKEIEIESYGNNRKQISGLFDIKRIQYYNPYLVPAGTNDKKYTIRITDVNQTLGRDAKNGLFTFYLPLPAQTGKETGSGHSDTNYTGYRLKVKLLTTDGKKSEKVLNAKIRRNAITMMDALEITGWSDAASSDHGSSNVQVVGNGTALRPFQIYTVEDLQKIRNAYNAGDAGRINGQRITENTYIKVVRTDIILNTENWTAGINNFKGHFRCSSGSPTAAGITNNSHVPLFESISSQGSVDSVTVKGTIADYEQGVPFSPLCNVNQGVMRNCVNQVNVTSKNASVAGICVSNSNLITGCRNEGDLMKHALSATTINVAGICLNNNDGAVIRASTTLTRALLQGDNVAGVCMNNNSGGMVRDCNTIISRTAQTSNWGCIVFYNNANANVQNCYAAGILSTSGTVGGIVNVNRGNVLGCRNQMTLIVGLGLVAGIAATMESGEIRNCFQDGFGNITTQDGPVTCGGLVAYMTGGKVSNCYSTFQCTLGHAQPGSHVGGAVGVINAGSFENVYVYDGVGKVFYSSITTPATLSNCYSYSSQGTGSFHTEAIRRIYDNTLHDSIIVLNSDLTTHIITALQDWV
ncbi:MAG: hypothetical protein II532_03295, partial [Bacteroidales bacterium]|nr:hypothetical protein [Bacteroidales bacterium]